MARRYGSAGASPRHLVRSWRLRQLAAVLVAVLFVVAVAYGLPPLFALAAVVSAYAVYTVGEGRVARATAGAQAEAEVADHLRGFGTVVFGWRPPGVRYDVDIVVLEPTLTAVEVKRAAGRVRVRSDGLVLVDGEPIPGEPLRQAVRGAAAVRRALDEEDLVGAVLCVTGMRQRPRWMEWEGATVAICSARHLRRVLRRAGPRVGRREARELVDVLSSAE